MTLPDDPHRPAYPEPGVPEPALSAPVPSAEPAPVTFEPAAGTPRTPAPGEGAAGSPPGGGRKVTVAAVLAGAAAVASKVRQEAPKKVHEIRERRIAGRCVILTEVDGRQVAIGPYRDDQAARQDTGRVTAAPRVVELMSPASYFGPPDDGATTGPAAR